MNEGAPEVMSDVPGRLRLRMPTAAAGLELERRLREEPGVNECRWAPRTRSLVVLYRPEPETRSALMASVVPGSEAAASSGWLAAPNPSAPRSRSTLARAMAGVASEADAAVVRLTGGMLDLRIGLPLALTLWAVRQIARGNAGPLAWSSALWYAHALFREYAGTGENER